MRGEWQRNGRACACGAALVALLSACTGGGAVRAAPALAPQAVTEAATVAASIGRASVVAPAASMHSKATLDADVVSQAAYGATVAVLALEGGWARIRTFDEYEGWVLQDDIRWLRPGEADYGAAGSVLHVTSLFANLYREPSVTRHKPLVVVPLGTILEVATPADSAPAAASSDATPVVQTRDPRWLMVLLPDRRSAWVQRGDVTAEWPELPVPDLVTFAKRFLGVPYLWGGTTSLGLDCSGYMQLLMRRRGVTLPRDAGPQSRWERTRVVDRGDLRPGDLLYFGEVETKITHTGMYIGDGEFIHATANTTPVVQISRIDAEPWTTLLKRCRRLEP